MKNKDKGSWVIGGCTMIGLGIGFVFLKVNVFYFIASILGGIGLGLVLAAFLPGEKD